MAKSDGSGSKRRRLAACGDADNLADLSGDALAAIAAYLPKTSRALLAVALTASPSSWRERGWRGEPSDAGRTILAASVGPSETVLDMNKSELKGSGTWHPREAGQQKSRLGEYYGGGWEVLDFLDLEPELASKLTDDDIGAMLACIDAGRMLKKLFLTKCSSFAGGGLEPLRGSSALEQIDFDILHLCRFSTPVISQQEAFSVIGDVLGRETNAFRCMKVPPTWFQPHAEETKMLLRFLSRREHVLNMSTECCYFGHDRDEAASLGHCKWCDGRSYRACADCNILLCSDTECFSYDDNAMTCSQCRKFSCTLCLNNRGVKKTVGFCDDPDRPGFWRETSTEMCRPYCDDCRYTSCREKVRYFSGSTLISEKWANECEYCQLMISDRLSRESTEQEADQAA